MFVSGRLNSSYLKKVFSPGIGVEPSSLAGAQVPTRAFADIREYACGLRPTKKNRSDGDSRKAGILGLALISNENPNFDITSKL
jgi:hypothetical protein